MVGFSAFVTLLLLFASLAASLTTDGLALLALKSAISSDSTGVLDAWLDSDPNPCGWLGVTCRGGRVTALALSNRSLEGYLPSELSLLSSLQTLSLPHNRLSGPIPDTITALRSLAALDLSHNNLSGPIPAEIGALDSLSHIDLSSNLLNGSLPPALAALPRLSGVLNLSCNSFSGRIPPAFGTIPVALSLDLRQNNLSDEIPRSDRLSTRAPPPFLETPASAGSHSRIRAPAAPTRKIRRSLCRTLILTQAPPLPVRSRRRSGCDRR